MREILQRRHYQPHARRCAISTALGLGNLQDVKPAFVSERAVSAKTGNDLDGRLPFLLARDFLDLHVPVLRPGAIHVAQLPTPRSNVIACFCSRIERGLHRERDLDRSALQDVLQPLFGDPELKRKA